MSFVGDIARDPGAFASSLLRSRRGVLAELRAWCGRQRTAAPSAAKRRAMARPSAGAAAAGYDSNFALEKAFSSSC